MLDFIKNKKDCTGCWACYNICPVNCIQMLQDEEGFKYPFADDRCIHCGLCEKVCPIESDKTHGTTEIDQHVCAALTKDHSLWKKSSSGGAFSEICNAYGDEETVVFGAVFNGLKVKHIYVIGIENIAPFRKSKYLQSDIGNSFIEVKQFLKEGKKVIFSGTPCQISGLKSYLNINYTNLLCVDFICHGVGSQSVFEAYIEYYEDKYDCEIESYSFRNQVGYFGNKKDYVSRLKLKGKGSKYRWMDEYNQLFIGGYCLRPSCSENCLFSHKERFSDITIADLKGQKNILPKKKTYKNFSTIIFNSKKGYKLVGLLKNKMEIYPILLKDVKQYNPRFTEACTLQGEQFREVFFSAFFKKSFKDLLVMYNIDFDDYKINTWKSLIPYVIKIYLRDLIKR